MTLPTAAASTTRRRSLGLMADGLMGTSSATWGVDGAPSDAVESRPRRRAPTALRRRAGRGDRASVRAAFGSQVARAPGDQPLLTPLLEDLLHLCVRLVQRLLRTH